ncbi:hypothetical protein C7M84_003007 [Penaeus vannamei]|uniref:Uncharacterized protein n=1 Tax=Penaeus vannamei TaxID=6689 RepID=A0A3R7PP75_PENVA|nr:hypothetical protein C7M84_003007 [Penaeus vannamei]
MLVAPTPKTLTLARCSRPLPVSAPAVTAGDAVLRPAHLAQLFLAGAVVAHDARVDSGAGRERERVRGRGAERVESVGAWERERRVKGKRRVVGVGGCIAFLGGAGLGRVGAVGVVDGGGLLGVPDGRARGAVGRRKGLSLPVGGRSSSGTTTPTPVPMFLRSGSPSSLPSFPPSLCTSIRFHLPSCLPPLLPLPSSLHSPPPALSPSFFPSHSPPCLPSLPSYFPSSPPSFSPLSPSLLFLLPPFFLPSPPPAFSPPSLPPPSLLLPSIPSPLLPSSSPPISPLSSFPPTPLPPLLLPSSPSYLRESLSLSGRRNEVEVGFPPVDGHESVLSSRRCRNEAICWEERESPLLLHVVAVCCRLPAPPHHPIPHPPPSPPYPRLLACLRAGKGEPGDAVD